jgi:hypothetical protein
MLAIEESKKEYLPWPDSALNIVVSVMALKSLALVAGVHVAHTTKGVIDHTLNIVERVVVKDGHFGNSRSFSGECRRVCESSGTFILRDVDIQTAPESSRAQFCVIAHRD